MSSIRREISVRLLAGACLLLVSAGLVLGWFIQARVLALFDHALEAKARALGALTSIEGKYLEFDFADEHMPEFSDEEEPEYFQLRLRGTRVIARSESLKGAGELPPGPNADGAPVFHNMRLPDGRRGRVVHLAVHPRREIGEEEIESAEDLAATLSSAANAAGVFVTIAVARSREELDALLWSVYGTLAGMVVLVLAGIVLLVRHAGVVRCFTADRPDGLDLVIENDAQDVTQEDVQHVFEPFWRKDPARRTDNHAGLGLSIVKALCDLLGIGLRIEIAGGRLFVVRLSFAEMAAR